ncbi:hypothetical protein [Klebsiella aerogenes]|uniref:hypothetical protein n=1 Tax=Klebsiella aerogenes TaxID=548 RepID=UPI00351CD0DF
MAQYTDEELYDALRQAHAAGDAKSASRLAEYIRERHEQRATPSDPTALNEDAFQGLDKYHEQTLAEQAELGLKEAGKSLITSAANLADIIPEIGDSAVSAAVWAGNKFGFGDGTYTPAARFKDMLPDELKPETKAGKVASEVIPAIAGWEKSAAMVPEVVGAKLAERVAGRAAKSAAGSIGSQLATGEEPDLKETAEDILINELTHGIFRGVKGSMNKVKGFIGQPDPEMMRTAEHLGVDPSLALASGGKGAQVIEGALTKSPGGAGVMERYHDDLLTKIDGFINRTIDRLGGRADDSTQLGTNIRNVLRTFVADFKSSANKKYDKFFSLMPKNSRVDVKETKNMLDEVLSVYKDDPALQEVLSNPTLVKIKAALDASKDGKISIDALRGLRTDVGDALMNRDGLLADNVAQAELQRLYSTLSQDIHQAAGKAGPQARSALLDADRFWAEGRDRVDNYLKPISSKVNGDEVFNALFGSTPGRLKDLGPVRAKELLSAMPEKQRNEFVAEIIQRLGESPAGQQGAEGGEFSLNTFLTNWNKMKPETRKVLFSDPEVRKDMDSLAKFAEKYKARTKALNTSNTAQAVNVYQSLRQLGSAGAAFAVGGPGLAIAAAILEPTVTALTSHATAKMMTSPRFIHWMASVVDPARGPTEKRIGQLLSIYWNELHLRDDISNYVDQQTRGE